MATDQMAELAACGRPVDSTLQDDTVMDGHGKGTKRRKFYQTTEDNRFLLPVGLKLSQPQPTLPELMPDLLTYESNRREDIVGCYGIPASFILSGAKNTSKLSNNTIDDNDFVLWTKTLQTFEIMLTDLILEVYLQIHQDLKGKSNVQFIIPQQPNITNTGLYQLYNQDVIDQPTMKKYLLDMNGLRQTDAAKAPNNITRPVPGTNENQTTAVMDAKVRVMNAEAAEKERGEKGENGELINKQMELETMKVEGQMKIMEMKMKMEEQKLKADIQKMTLQIRVNKSVKVQPKSKE
jgi:hypothetical protein